jgi:hypothetical protein
MTKSRQQCHSAARKESPFLQFLKEEILNDLKNFANFFCQKVKIGGIDV